MMIMKIVLGILLLSIQYIEGTDNDVTIEEKLNMTTMELIKAQGYHAEEFEAETKDGYILKVQRIPYGKDGPSDKKKTPVFLMHGVASESSIWIDQREKSLAFLLANKDYDVWLGNMRGNRNSNHKKYSRDDPRFWDFTWDDHGKYDLPAMWDLVLEKTGYSKIYNIGLSLGVTTTLFNLADSEKYNSKFLGFFAMGPVSRMTYSTNQLFRILTAALPLLNVAGPVLFIPFQNNPGKPPCSPNCTDTELLVYKHTHSGTSLKGLLQGLQLVNSKEFSHFNYFAGNYFKYRCLQPPVYNLVKITTPVALYSSANDNLADPLDVARLQMDLQNVIRHRIIEDDLFEHGDFLRHPEVDKYVYNPIIEDMQLVQE